MFGAYIYFQNPKEEIKLNDVQLHNNQTTSIAINHVATIPEVKAPVRSAKILITGDVMLARSIGEKIKQGKNPFMYVKDLFAKYDYVVINLECVISNKGSAASGKLYTFEAPIESLDFIKESNIDAVSLANNHTMDYGPEALTDMVIRLKEKGIGYFGAGKNSAEAFTPLYVNLNGNEIAFLGFNNIETHYTAVKDNSPGNANFDIKKMKQSLDEAKSKSQIIIPYLHWGVEYSQNYNKFQKDNAYFLIDNNASIVVGNHPHVTQQSEVYKDKKIFYSLGNYVFDQMYGGAALGDMLEISINNGTIIDTRLIKIQIDKDGFPRPL